MQKRERQERKHYHFTFFIQIPPLYWPAAENMSWEENHSSRDGQTDKLFVAFCIHEKITVSALSVMNLKHRCIILYWTSNLSGVYVRLKKKTVC